jgi:hypothetical protein
MPGRQEPASLTLKFNTPASIGHRSVHQATDHSPVPLFAKFSSILKSLLQERVAFDLGRVMGFLLAESEKLSTEIM